MLIVLCSLVALGTARIIRVGLGLEYPASQILNAVANAAPGDIVELSAGEYLLAPTTTGVCLSLTKAITLRGIPTASGPAILRAATSDGVDAIVGISSSGARLENIVIGRPVAGAEQSLDRLVAVLVEAGTQAEPPAFGQGLAYGAARKRSTASLDAIRSAREPSRSTAKRSAPSPPRAISGVVLRGVDFTASTSHTNLGFGAGLYVNVTIADSRFSASPDTNSIVTAPSARFESPLVSRNSFAGSPIVDNGSGFGVGANFWAPALRSSQATYCVDRACTRFGPVVDAENPSRVFPAVANAVAAGVRRITITARSVEWALDDAHACTVVVRADTTIEGVDITTCSQQSSDADSGLGVSTINLRRKASGSCQHGALTTLPGALASLRNVHLAINDGVAVGLAVVDVRNRTVDGVAAPTLLLERVTVYGRSTQTAILLAAPSARVVLTEFRAFDVSTGVEHVAGSLSVADSAFVGNDRAAIYLSGRGAHGLRVVGTLFLNRATALLFDGVQAASMTDFYVACSRFLFAALALPTDCATGTLCGSALRHNTFIVEPHAVPANIVALLARGANHYEEDLLANSAQYFAFTGDASHSQFAFALHDRQGRIDDAAGVATIGGAGTRWSFILATHIQMRQECFAASVPAIDGAKGRVVSNLFDLHTDAPFACVSVALRLSLAGSDVALGSEEELVVYAVDHVGSIGASWTRAAAHTLSTGENGATTAIDASSGGGKLTRAVVVAAHTNLLAATAGVRAVRPSGAPVHAALAAIHAARPLCVACGGDRIPANVIDERCAGGSGTPVFTDINLALAAVTAVKTTSVSLLVYGNKCVASSCTIDFGVMAPNKVVIEGLSPTDRGTLRRRSACAASVPFIRAGSGVTLRYLLIAPDTNVASAVPVCAIDAPARATDGPRLAYLTISGGVCIGKGRVGTVLLNNEISVARDATAVSIAAGATGAAFDSNVFVSGVVTPLADSSFASNVFGPDAYLAAAQSTARLSVIGNTFVARRADTAHRDQCVEVGERATLVADANDFGDHCLVSMVGAKHELRGGTWTGVRARVTGALRLVGVSLGVGASVEALGGVILENVVIDLLGSSVGDALLGAPVRESRCANEFEPAAGGFDLAKSTIYDARGVQLLVADWPTTPSSFVLASNGTVFTCGSFPMAEYCVCLAKHSVERQRVDHANRLAQNQPEALCGVECPLIPNTIVAQCLFDLIDVYDTNPVCFNGKCVGADSEAVGLDISCESAFCTAPSSEGLPCSCSTCACIYTNLTTGTTHGSRTCSPIVATPAPPSTAPTTAPTTAPPTTPPTTEARCGRCPEMPGVLASVCYTTQLITIDTTPRCEQGVCVGRINKQNGYSLTCQTSFCTDPLNDQAECSCDVCACLYSIDNGTTVGAQNCVVAPPSRAVSHTELWIVLGSLGGVALCIFIFVALCYCTAADYSDGTRVTSIVAKTPAPALPVASQNESVVDTSRIFSLRQRNGTTASFQ